jgi:DNA-binding transcriptional ArsR family regulator
VPVAVSREQTIAELEHARWQLEVASGELDDKHVRRLEAIQAARKAGVPVAEIAEALGVSRQAVYQLLEKR